MYLCTKDTVFWTFGRLIKPRSQCQFMITVALLRICRGRAKLELKLKDLFTLGTSPRTGV